MSEYKIEEHTYDVVVVGAGGAGLRATLGMAEQGLKNRLRDQSVPHAQPHGCRARRNRRQPVEYGAGQLAVAYV